MDEKKITKDTVPEGFSWQMATVDAIPVLFFGANAILIGKLISSPVFIIGAVLCFLSGLLKVLWKYIVALKQKNIWFLFVQMRIAMPLSFAVMIIALLIQKNVSITDMAAAIITLPSVVFFGLGMLGMVLMMVFAFKLDSSDPKSNWIEQITNGISQAMIFVGLLLL